MSSSLIILITFVSSVAETSWEDARFTKIRETNTVFEMTPFESLLDWEQYRERLQRTILVSSGLWPMPERTPLNPQITGRIEYDDYIIENVAIEAWPGLWVTGNLYRPHGEGPFPGILCPHGHWGGGRLEDTDQASVPARGITFARMGMVAFAIDMVGYNDSVPFSFAWGHSTDPSHATERRLQALWGIHPFGIQLWSAIRALDYLESLPYVDSDRLACTGASGGGTQTFALSAVDDRVQVSAPVNMISHTMQGGCVCENAPLIRLDASNMEIGAMAAPRPMMLVSTTGDWTSATPEVEYPAIRSIYALYDATHRLGHFHGDASHNFNQASREAVYRFFAKWLLDAEEEYADFEEPPYESDVDTLRVFPDGPPEAPDADTFLSQRIADMQAQWEGMLPNAPEGIDTFRETYRPALADALAMVNAPEEVDILEETSSSGDDIRIRTYVLGDAESGVRIPAMLFEPVMESAEKGVLVVHPLGMEALLTGDSVRLNEELRVLLDAGRSIMLIDPFGIGRASGKRQPAGFPDTFLPTDTAYRVHDIVAAARWLSRERGEATTLVGLDGAGIWTLLAAAMMPEHEGAVYADLGGFDVNSDEQWEQIGYVLAIRSLGDLRTAAVLTHNRPVKLFGVADTDAFNQIEGFLVGVMTGSFSWEQLEVAP